MGESTIRFWKPEKGTDLELLPCPFCGNDEIIYEEYEHAAGPRWRVFCTKCIAGIDPGYAQKRHIVQAMWNRRESK